MVTHLVTWVAEAIGEVNARAAQVKFSAAKFRWFHEDSQPIL